jgi:hypothetical protein
MIKVGSSKIHQNHAESGSKFSSFWTLNVGSRKESASVELGNQRCAGAEERRVRLAYRRMVYFFSNSAF